MDGNLRKVLGIRLSEVITGKAQIKPAMDQAATEIKAIMTRAGYYKT